MEFKKVSFIGLGVMGYPMAGYLKKNNLDVSVFNRTISKAKKWSVEFGGNYYKTPGLSVVNSDAVFICVGRDEDLREVMEGNDGILENTKKGTIIVDHTPEFPIRIMLKDEKVAPDFANWLRGNRDKSRIGDKALQSIDNGHHLGGFYFHVRDEKVLSIVHMLIGHAIRGIYNLVYMPPTIDK